MAPWAWQFCCSGGSTSAEEVVVLGAEELLEPAIEKALAWPAASTSSEDQADDQCFPDVSTTAPSSSSASDASSAPEVVDSEVEECPLASSTAAANPDVRSQLSAADAATVLAVEAELGPADLHRLHLTLVPGEALEACLLRFARVHGKVKQTAKALRGHVAWHEAARPDVLASLSPGGAAGCADELVERYMPTWHQGFDRKQRPIVWSHYGRFRVQPFQEAGVGVDGILKLQIRNSYITSALCGEQSLRHGRDISQALVVIDAEGLDSQVAMSKFTFEFARAVTKLDQEHFPDRMGQLLVINAPPAVQCVYRASAWIVPERERSRVRILGGREQWLPALMELIDADQLPLEYGGIAKEHVSHVKADEV